ncbi:MAG TPA: transglycosylase SLT domain-containing protein [Candidatus Binataceae bacterium]|nr:transglycosylase SLT domain-containing protein [Candidatus Binataceae bacterium]
MPARQRQDVRSVVIRLACTIVLALALSSLLRSPAAGQPATNDPRAALVEGYRAYERRDFATTISAMQLVLAKLPEAADYAAYYLASAQAQTGDLINAAANYRHLQDNYPSSIFAADAGVEYARAELKLGNPANAEAAARRVALATGDPSAEQNARLLIAEAAAAQGRFAEAYAEAQALRERFPRGGADPAARALADSLRAAHPAVVSLAPLEFHYREAELLVREGALQRARGEIEAARALNPPPGLRVDLAWLEAAASRDDLEAWRAALLHYLALAPTDAHVAEAMTTLGHLYWRANDTVQARYWFDRVAARYPSDAARAAEAMFDAARTCEDDGDRDAARRRYLRLIARYPASDAAAQARFRAPFMLYMDGHYAAAATEFAAAARRADDLDWAMFAYWQARALEQSGNRTAARALLRAVAADKRSNYYPALALDRLRLDTASAAASPPAAFPNAPIPVADGVAGFHLARIALFRQIGLRELEAGELRAIAATDDPLIRRFILDEAQAAGAWYDAIQVANRMVASGQLSSAATERIRYPRGFWDLISRAASTQGLDPWLVSALIRQESLYNPRAVSGSDARGLMQLLPTTAEHWAPAAGLNPLDLDLFDPQTSVRIGTTYLKALLAMFDNDPLKAVAAYNGGEHAVAAWSAKFPGDGDQWVENIGYKETRDYVKKVIGGRREYRLLYEPAYADVVASVSSSANF